MMRLAPIRFGSRKLPRKLLWLILASAISLPGAGSVAASDTLAERAQAAYDRKDYKRGAELFQAMVEAGLQGADAPYNAACCFARLGNKREAFKFLALALRRGMSKADFLTNDSDLTSLHDDPQWQPLLEACRKRGQIQERLWDGKAFESPYRDNLSDDEKIAGLSKLWLEVKINFVNFDRVPDLNWDALYLAYLPRVRQTKSTLEYYKLLMTLCAQLKDAHTNVYPPPALMDAVYARPQLLPRLVEGKVLIVRVLDDKLLKEGIKPGMEVLEVNGIPVQDYARQEVIPYISSTTKQDLEVRAYSYFLFSGKAGEPLRLTLADSKGDKIVRTVPRASVVSKPKTDKKPKTDSVPPLKWKLYPDRIAYVPIDTFETDLVVKQFKTTFPEIAKASALVLDLRDNGGGNSSVSFQILGMLTDKPFRSSRWQTRDYRPVFRAAGVREEEWYEDDIDKWPADGALLYKKPVIVLTSPRTFSAAEDFCVAFDFLKRGTIIGEPTGGSTGQPLSFKLPGGGSARVCTKHDTYPDGKEFVGVGVQPNKVVVPTIADLRANRDTVLEAALAEARRLSAAK
jgi:C-terminal processing protease CtpA/Prc